MIQSQEISLNEISHHYDELDKFYRKLWGTHLHHGLWKSKHESKDEAVLNLSHRVLRELGNLNNKSFIDIGCGYGGTTRLAGQAGAQRVTGITISKKQFDYAQVYDDQRTDYVHGDWLENPFKNHQFDGGFAIECFSHIHDKKKFFEEVKRTIKPGGKFVMTAWLAKENATHLCQSLILKPICREGRLPSLFSNGEILRLSIEAGLVVEKEIDLSDKVWRTWLISVKKVLQLSRTAEGIRYFLNTDKKERKFALTVLRILLGYKVGCFKYGLYVMRA